MSALLAVCAIGWPALLLWVTGWFFDRHPGVTDRIGESLTDHYWCDYYGE